MPAAVVEVKVPSAGESVTEMQVAAWNAAEGDTVERDQVIVELETDKATSEVTAPTSGRLTKILIGEGETVEVGDVLAQIEEGEGGGESAGDGGAETAGVASTEQKTPNQSASPQRGGTTADPRREEATASAPSAGKGSGAGKGAGGHVMPAAKALLDQNGLNASQVSGTGPGGRVLKEDVQNYLKNGKKGELVRADAPAAAPMTTGPEGGEPGRAVKRQRMTPIRKKIAASLVSAQQNAALLTTFNEIDMTAVKEARAKYGEAFQKKYDIKLGFSSFFVKAVVDALQNIPQVGAQIDGDELVYYDYCDISVAVGGGKGLTVPVIRNAETLSFAEIEQTVADFGRRAKEGKIGLDELQGGTFTITNGGIYGSLLSTPIVNPPQSGILGMHNIVDRPMVVNGEIVIRPMMYVALTYDHRVVDGREAVTFLMRIKESIEDPGRMLMEV
ncbi:2-oxoglutarate dehydrogenase complex dihydrolipoyllysine-residue succinyltransferase [Alienimonas californiensis]|uniref:Dihydrolipoyllysine-residue succinyltransferase component of 2-oxoglutarate dehydrogenase complex n=1 Tax=Alienimonas californiensis TaxID=2527989 RepID=A0A517P7B5_9PLAN|nr:2-oxoglutarate dehydrogenase complex dihydrolipoyllysine-residue succinyltransferase [Alienimonas californiensis]QDT15268.1 Dihydrolipoyllysine-residue succinyltransferase component of 2-oxoglutarate dehydrogenase complex [Alienimonas californiensis]